MRRRVKRIFLPEDVSAWNSGIEARSIPGRSAGWVKCRTHFPSCSVKFCPHISQVFIERRWWMPEPDAPALPRRKGTNAAMPLENGQMIAKFYGRAPHAQAVDKIAQMRRDLSHIQRAVHSLEHRIKASATGDQMRSEFTILYKWCVSLMESLFALTWAAYDKNRAKRSSKTSKTSSRTSPPSKQWC
jgi:hypothetical protein